MVLFDELLNLISNGQSLPPSNRRSEHSVIIEFYYGLQGLTPLHDLERVLEKEIREAQVGEYDWHEINMDYSDGLLFMYGPNAENLFKCVRPILERTDFMKGAIATLRFGPPEDGVPEIDIEI